MALWIAFTSSFARAAVFAAATKSSSARSTVRQRCDGTEPIADSASASIDLKPVPSQAETASADFSRFCNAGISSSRSSISPTASMSLFSFSALSMRARIAACSANIILVSAGSEIRPTSSRAPASAALTVFLSSTRR